MADITKTLNISKHTYHDVISKVVDAIKEGREESEQMRKIISFFPEWSSEQVFIAGYAIGRVAERESQRYGRHEKHVFIFSDRDEEREYADKRNK